MTSRRVIGAAVAAAVIAEAAGFAGSLPNLGLRRAGAPASRVCMQDDEINTKKVAG